MAVAALGLFAPVALANEPMVVPEPIEFPHPVDVGKVRGAILNAVARRKWITEADFGDALVVALRVRSHVLKMRIEYGSRSARLVYADSENLDYEIDDGVPHIHHKVNRWLNALDLEMQRELQLVIFERDRVDVIPPEAGDGTEVIPAEPAPEPLVAGDVAFTRTAVNLMNRPMQDADVSQKLPAGATVQLVSSIRNVSGVWWYVKHGSGGGWVEGSALRPAGSRRPAD